MAEKLTALVNNSIFEKVTGNIFKEYGLRGHSMEWIDDQYWYRVRITFYAEPTQFTRFPPQGCSVHIAVVFQWAGGTGLDYKNSSFRPFESEKQFESDVECLAKDALKSILELRKQMSNLKTAQETMLKSDYFSHKYYHLAIICGLNNSVEKANEYFDLVLKNDSRFQKSAAKLKPELDDLTGFRKKMDEIVARTRNETRIRESKWNLEKRCVLSVLFAEADKDKNLGAARIES